ncbi:MAG: UDP-2,3-diacylglucosamine diphosphatase [Candidatus Methylopumilus sp.]|jgi:UDP-2,3-diacylglucosamine hydrolase
MTNVGNASSYSLFISDLHLCSSRPGITQQFLTFLSTSAPQADALYVLGDLFEYWAGDDDLGDTHHQAIVAAFKTLRDTGTAIYFMHGNRDFLIAQKFAQAAGMQILDDPTLLKLYGHQVLLSHGDALCTDDTSYQQFRQQVRNPAWQKSFLEQPLSARKAQIEALRQRSENEKSQKSLAIMDVNAEAVTAIMREHHYPQFLIHGHTHRPARHLLSVDGHSCQRWVLGDWYEQGSCLRFDSSGCSVHGI